LRVGHWPHVLGGVVLVWCLAMAGSALQAARARPHDDMGEQDATFRAFAIHLPRRGTIGYLQPFDGWSEAAVRTHYAAEYALAPRIVVEARNDEFMIVARGAERPGGDPRLNGYVLVATLPEGHRLFRRFP
jgi:hypothetical protein